MEIEEEATESGVEVAREIEKLAIAAAPSRSPE